MLFLSLVWSCQKCPTPSQLTGTWIEENDVTAKSKLIFFEGDSLYFFHSTSIDTLTYTLDTKHNTIFLTFKRHLDLGISSCSITYHKRKKILTMVGLLPANNGNATTTNYKQ